MNDLSQTLETIFGEAIEISSRQDRVFFLDRACQGNADLRRKVEKLVEDHFRAGRFLESPALEQIATVESRSHIEQPGAMIGPYKLRELLGEGGMGRVYVAEQETPVRRKVALKIIKPGMDSRQVLARFEAERQALSLMDHPNIAKVLDAGTTSEGDGGQRSEVSEEKPALALTPDLRPLTSRCGRPYFVMELVRGVPITQFCDQRRLTPRKRLELFIQVCRAIQHAHQKGIIHRDIKPSNILVTLHDDLAVPKVIDFGIAKATSQRLTEQTVYTAFNQMVGTPLYMSPEQAEMNALDVDTRSDIYSLGVLLYELLAGSTPFDNETLRQAGFDEMRRLIREVDPPRPSARVSSLSFRERAGVRETANPATTIAESRGVDERQLHRELRGELDWIVMKCLEKDRNRRYETAAALAADIQHYLNDEPVTAVAPSRLYRASKFVRRNKLTVIASFAVLLGLVAGVIGMAVGLVSQSRQRSADERERAESQFNLANALQSQAKYADAEALYRKGLEANLGATPQDRQRAARTRLRLAQMAQDRGDRTEAERLHRDALAAYRGAFSPGDPNIAQALGELANILQAQQRFAESEPLIREAHEIHRNASPADHFLIATSGTLLGNVLITLGRHAEAEPILLEAIAEHELVVPPDKLALALTRTVLGRDLIMIGKFPEAERQLLEAEKVLSLTTYLNYGQVALASLYSRWEQTEPHKGYDAKAQHWFDNLIDAFLVPPRPPNEPPSATGTQTK